MSTVKSTALLKAYFIFSALAPWLLRRIARKAHDKQAAPKHRRAERFGRATLPRPQGKLIWVHAASVGEVQSIAALASLLCEHATLLVTTTTQTGAARVTEALPEGTLHQFAPIDTQTSVSRFLATWQPDLAVFVEGDIWPRMSAALAAQNTPTALVNARPSRSRARFKRTFQALLAPFNLISCQSDSVREGFLAQGFAPEQVHSIGNLKAAPAMAKPSAEVLQHFKDTVGNRPAWAAVSTHAADEANVLCAHAEVLSRFPDALLFWLPRHPERAEAIREATNLPLAQRSLKQAPTHDTAIYLVDTIGEADAVFQTVGIAFLGGSFGQQGGHTPYEPAHAGVFVLHGPNVGNFVDAYAELHSQNSASVVTGSADLAKQICAHFNTPEAPNTWSARKHANSVEKTRDLLLPLLKTI
ncbi:3-deoxy-D-manno-octulosonic acid transferase [Lentibacter algarum]|uniref:3-deoxy-D-manno-octulosonic acid transferase n=1 Tax=Lentibacter algarum TaxID=576131 RepID=UPI001C06C824|nr:glycosyltransferase N-terminal domain-containing protein [Lentibacter algarum]MBU2982045.1 3-deoxy-D-manno-octulosonic acid transferase [Lentibacter algarum]